MRDLLTIAQSRGPMLVAIGQAVTVLPEGLTPSSSILGYLVGQVMKLTGGTYSPDEIRVTISRALWENEIP